jgi:hypothetical protein
MTEEYKYNELRKELAKRSEKFNKLCEQYLNEKGKSEKFYLFVRKLKETQENSQSTHHIAHIL